jgi:hypothetical protein
VKAFEIQKDLHQMNGKGLANNVDDTVANKAGDRNGPELTTLL